MATLPLIADIATRSLSAKERALTFLPNSAGEMVPPHIGTMWMAQRNLNCVADLAAKINARAEINFRQGACLKSSGL